MPDLYDPHRWHNEPPPGAYDDSTDDDFGGWGMAIALSAAAVLLMPILAGLRAWDWIHDRRKLGKDVHRLLRGR